MKKLLLSLFFVILLVGVLFAEGFVVNINNCTINELKNIYGIGQTYAKRIVDYRAANGDYKSVDDLLKVKGITAAKLNKFKEYLSVTQDSIKWKIDINTGDGWQLASVPKIGQAIAVKIIAYRAKTPFTAIEDLMKVSGISSKTFESIKFFVTVNPAEAKQPNTYVPLNWIKYVEQSPYPENVKSSSSVKVYVECNSGWEDIINLYYSINQWKTKKKVAAKWYNTVKPGEVQKWYATIPKQAAGSVVQYYFEGVPKNWSGSNAPAIYDNNKGANYSYTVK